jgi:anthranilate phosphoribosyltransferase
MASIVVAGAGVPVCKHGARAASSQCGTADVLEELGVAVELSPLGVKRCVEKVGMGFCLAPRYHPAFRFAAPSRREIGIPTVFNLLGPMANPGRVKRQLIGVANPRVAERMLASLRLHGSTSSWVVHGQGLDELTTTGSSTVLELRGGQVRTFTVDPVSLGLAPAISDELVGGTPSFNAAVVRRVMAGEQGAHRNIVVLNAGAGLVVADAAGSLEEGLALAVESIDSGRAARVLDSLIAESQAARDEFGS